MKKIVIFLIVLLSFNGFTYSQDAPKFNLTKDGVEPVVLTFDASLTANQIYKKVKEWVAANYKNYNITIRIDSENTVVKIGAFKDKAWKIYEHDIDYWYSLEYTLNIEIKDAKCRVTFDTPDVRYKVWFDKDGNTLDKFKDSEAIFEANINEPLSTLYKYIKEPKKVTKDDW